MPQITTPPTPISQDPSDIAYEFLGISPASIGKVTDKAAPASHGHALGRTVRQVTGFGLSQTLQAGALLGNGYAFLVSDTGALPALPLWTMECWLRYSTVVQTGVGFWEQGTAVPTPNPVGGPVGSFTDLPPQIGITDNGALQTSMVFGDGSSLVISHPSGWAHYALCYDGATFYCFVGGVLQGTHSSSAGAIPAGWLAGVGAFADNNNGGSITIDEMRISNVPRYTADFTPPTKPFVTDSATVALWHMSDTPLGAWINQIYGAGYSGPQYPGAITVGSGWGWVPSASGDSSGNGIDLGVATYNGGNSASEAIFCQIAGITSADAIINGAAVTSLQAQTGDLVLTDTAGNSVAKPVPQTDGTIELQTSLMAFKAAWSSTTAYAVGDTVTSGGLTYVCIANNTNNVPPNATYWAAVGGGGGGPVASTYEQEITVTTPVTVLTYTPAASGLFQIDLYLRVITAATTVEVQVTSTDATGAQTWTALPSTSEPVGSYTIDSLVIAATAGDPIDVIVTAGTANQVYFSSGIKEA